MEFAGGANFQKFQCHFPMRDIIIWPASVRTNTLMPKFFVDETFADGC